MLPARLRAHWSGSGRGAVSRGARPLPIGCAQAPPRRGAVSSGGPHRPAHSLWCLPCAAPPVPPGPWTERPPARPGPEPSPAQVRGRGRPEAGGAAGGGWRGLAGPGRAGAGAGAVGRGRPGTPCPSGALLCPFPSRVHPAHGWAVPAPAVAGPAHRPRGERGPDLDGPGTGAPGRGGRVGAGR